MLATSTCSLVAPIYNPKEELRLFGIPVVFVFYATFAPRYPREVASIHKLSRRYPFSETDIQEPG
jgi:hypothetical protein